MNKFSAQGIVLARTDYGEAARIVTFLTPNHGKVRAMAKGVHKPKSKLAGGIELFAVNDLSLLAGRGEIKTLISARLAHNFGNIIKQIDRTNTAYEAINLLNKNTEDNPEAAYFNLLSSALAALDDLKIPPALSGLWLRAQLLKLAGHAPNLRTDEQAKKLVAGNKYDFDLDTMCFKVAGKNGTFSSAQIQFLRLAFGSNSPQALNRIKDVEKLVTATAPLVQTMLQTYLRI